MIIIDKNDPQVLIAAMGADGHFLGGVKRLDDGSLYVWLDQPGRGRVAKCEAMVDDAEAALDAMIGGADIDATFYFAPEMLTADRTVDPEIARKQAQLVAIRAASPMRPIDGRTADVDGLALFDAVRSPCLI